MINQASTKDFKKAVILSGAFPREDLIRRHRRHPEASLFEAVRISSFSFFILTKHSKDEIATSHNTFLTMTEKLDGILTSHNTLLRMFCVNCQVKTTSRLLFSFK